MTMRPQLGSSPAIAVLTSGELPIARAMRRAARSWAAPVTLTVTNLLAPSPSRATCWARSRSRSSRAARKPSRRWSSGSTISGLSALPVAAASTVSEVEVSLSTVMQLKLRSAASASRACSVTGGSFASVKAKASIVAMSGAIMPEPLAIPVNVTGTPPISAWRTAPLGKVSVVMIASAAACQGAVPSASARSSRRSVMRSAGSGSPITPVEATKTCSRAHFRTRAAAATSSPTAASPLRPVKALALPAFTRMARPRPMPACRAWRHHSTGAAAVSERVNTPATAVPSASSNSATSARSR